MIVATWNINSVRSRLPHLLAWLQVRQPDVVCIQELKTESRLFPAPAFWALGYHCAFHCERVHNGVAILSRWPMSDIVLGMGDRALDHEARLVSATVNGVRILSVYVPHGQTVGLEMYAHKLRFLRALRAHLDARYKPDDPLVLGGDFNVAPEARDLHDVRPWLQHTHFHIDSRVALLEVFGFGLTDTFRLHHTAGGNYTWWDYKANAFPKNHGLRIDLVLATAPMAKRCVYAAIDRDLRLGDHPSDHVPALAAFA